MTKLSEAQKRESYRQRFYALIEHFDRIGYPDPYRAALVLFRHNGRMAATKRRGRAVMIPVPGIQRP